MKAYVYRIFDRKGNIVYVGATNDIGERLRRHHERSWGRKIARLDVTVHDTWEEAREVEAQTIKALQPPHNQDHTIAGRSTGHRELEERILTAIRKGGPLSSVECEVAVLQRGFNGSRNSVSACVIRLRDGGQIVKVGERPAISGRWRTAALYDLPSKPAVAA